MVETNKIRICFHRLRSNVLKVDPEKNLVTRDGTTAKCVQTAKNELYCTAEVLLDIPMEFPQINNGKYNGKKYQYVYTVGFYYDEERQGSLLKVNVQNKKHLEWIEKNCHPSEHVFIPKPDGQAEDDGVLVSAVNKVLPDETTQCFLLVLDSKTMKELARVEFDGVGRFPKDFHGVYTPTTKNSPQFNVDRQNECKYS